MGILSGLFRSRDKPTDKTAGSSYSFFLGGTASVKYVTERSAMQMKAVYCCVRILSEAVASLRALGEILKLPQAFFFSFTEKRLADIINMTYSCHVVSAMICTERERL